METSAIPGIEPFVQQPPRTAPLGPILRIPAAVRLLKRWKLSRARFELLQQWEGIVTLVADREFEAVLHDLTDPRQPQEAASFLREDVGDSDQSMIAPGAVFYWNIGYRVSEAGQKERVSAIRFRRLPAWSTKDIEQAQARAAELMNLFGGST